MAYADQGAGGSRFASILLVVLIHIGIGAALIIGLGYEAVEKAVTTVIAIDVTEEEPEEPEEAPPPPEEIVEAPPPPIVAPPPPITPPTTNRTTTIPDIPTTRSCPGYGGRQFPLGADCPEPPQQSKTCQGYGNREFPANQACPAPPSPPTRAEPSNNPGTWVRQSDYERSWLDRDLEGTVGFAVTVGTNGRVQGCSVTASSGHSELDSATCRYITQRARFKAATQNGEKVTGSYASRVTWQIR